MPFSYAELEQFYEKLVTRARSRGIACAITSGMACVAFGVSEATKDCDLLCTPDSADDLLGLLGETTLGGHLPSYRGNLTPPLDARWFRGGWTSHFMWPPAESGAYLDIFGVAPRGSSPWEAEIQGFYASPHTVAEMKRTNRDKDWPFVTALGARMIEMGDERGWLHLYDEKLLRAFSETKRPAALIKRRPVLELAANNDPKLRPALRAEIEYWHELDRVRMNIYENAVRRYMVEVRKSHLPPSAGLPVQHDLRVRCAEKYLPENPMRDFGVTRMISEAREALSQIINPAAMEWLPDVHEHFTLLTA
ncbi:MAG TPA: hypothetical protein VG754_00360 [Verrucomicrobiae bacterium]|nr:hypothetical protein [Verrucomicrobiae bacterium]